MPLYIDESTIINPMLARLISLAFWLSPVYLLFGILLIKKQKKYGWMLALVGIAGTLLIVISGYYWYTGIKIW